MAQRLEQVKEDGEGSHSAEQARETLREMRRNLGELLREVPRPAQRVAMAVGEVSIEVEWPETDSREASGVGVRGCPADPAPPADGATVAEPAGEPVRSPLVGTFYQAPEPAGFQKSVTAVTCGDRGSRRWEMIARRVPTPDLPDLHPASQLAVALRSFIGSQGRGVARLAP